MKLFEDLNASFVLNTKMHSMHSSLVGIWYARRVRMTMLKNRKTAVCIFYDGCASVRVYVATKAFEKSLAASLGRKMERYDVGVTCLLAGAVKITEFASRSDVETAVCFQVPGYAKSPTELRQ